METGRAEAVTVPAMQPHAVDEELVRRLERRVARLEAERQVAPASPPRAGGAPFAARNVFAVLGMIALVVGALFVGYLAWKGITLVLIALLFALALNPAVEFFVARNLARGAAAALVFVLALEPARPARAPVDPAAVDQITNFVNALPDIVASASQGHGPLGALERRFHILENLPGAVSGSSSSDVGGVASSGLDVVLGVLGTLASIVIVAFLTFFMLLEGPAWSRRLIGLLPEAMQPRWERVAYAIYRTVGASCPAISLRACSRASPPWACWSRPASPSRSRSASWWPSWICCRSSG